MMHHDMIFVTTLRSTSACNTKTNRKLRSLQADVRLEPGIGFDGALSKQNSILHDAT